MTIHTMPLFIYWIQYIPFFTHYVLLQVSFKMEPYDLIVNQPVVIDNGSGVIKAGFAGDQVLCFWVEPEVTSFTVGASKPRIIFHCVFGNSVKRLAEMLSEMGRNLRKMIIFGKKMSKFWVRKEKNHGCASLLEMGLKVSGIIPQNCQKSVLAQNTVLV